MVNQFLYVLVVGTKRKPSVPEEKVTVQKTIASSTTTEVVDGRRLKKGCSLCKGTAGIPGDKHSRTTCTKLLVHGVNSSLKLHDLINLGARSISSVPQRLDFDIPTWKKTSPIFGCMLSFRTFSLLLWAWEVNTSLSSRLQASTTLVTLFCERRCLFYFLPWYENLKGA